MRSFFLWLFVVAALLVVYAANGTTGLRRAFGQEMSYPEEQAVFTIDHVRPDGTHGRTPSRVGYAGKAGVDHCFAMSSAGTPENERVSAKMKDLFLELLPGEPGVLRPRCNGARVVPFEQVAPDVALE